MKFNDIVVPRPIQVVMDDIGWIEGRTPYWDDWQPTRTGIPRRHTIEDYIMINEIGRSINMKINAMLVLGDWDRHGALSKAKYSNKLGEKWKGSPYVYSKNVFELYPTDDEPTAKEIEEELTEIVEYLNSCEYIELGIHGLLHECWDDNGTYMSAEFIPPTDFKSGDSSKNAPAPEWYLRQHLDVYMEIYKDWGFKQNLRTFSCPGACLTAWKDGVFPGVLKDYGVKYWHQHCIEGTYVENDVIMNHKDLILAPWENYDLNPDILPTYSPDKAGILSSHWPNYLRFDPKRSIENLDKWTAFFKRQGEVFGLILSRDMAFAHHQLLYTNNYTIEEVDGKVKIDLTKADAIAPKGEKAPLYISVKNSAPAPVCEGGIITEHEKYNDFTNYKIDRTDASVIYIK